VSSSLSLDDAIRKGCSLRVRPLLMTTMTTVLGLSPMLLAQGAGVEIQRPLAAVVLGGLTTSTALTLFILPVVYALVERRKQAGQDPS